jgi:hypothetical protein
LLAGFGRFTLTDPSPLPQGLLNSRLLRKNEETRRREDILTQKQSIAQEDFLVDLTLHNFSAAMVREFALKIVKPYFGGNMNQALRSLMEKAIEEETLFNDAVDKTL